MLLGLFSIIRLILKLNKIEEERKSNVELEIPKGYSLTQAHNKKGIIFTSPDGLTQIRVMNPTKYYPNKYVRKYQSNVPVRTDNSYPKDLDKVSFRGKTHHPLVTE